MTAVKIVESPKRTRYILCDVRGNMVMPITGRMYHSFAEAQAEAEGIGLKVQTYGDIYEITKNAR